MAGSVSVREISFEGQGGPLESGCKATGLERCFNATDDDCNGLVDEGCGLPDGDVALLAAWEDNPADLDWTLFVPGGKKLDKQAKRAGAFRYVKDCPEGCFGQNVEAIVTDGTPARGVYRAELRLKGAVGVELPVRVHVAARFGTRVEQTDVVFDLDHDARTITFTL